MISATPVGALGNGADDTTAIQPYLVEGVETFVFPPIEGGYTTGPLVIPTSLRRLVFESTVYQRASDETVFTGSGVHDLTIYDPKVRGVCGLNEPIPLETDTAFRLVGGCKNVEFSKGEISRFRTFAMYAEQGEDIRVLGTRSIETSFHFRFRGVKKPRLHRAVVARSCLVPEQFTVGIGFDSTDGHSLGLCSDIDVSKCRIEDLGHAQGVLHHGGVGFEYQDNLIRNCAIAISANPYNTEDDIADGVISGNRIWGLDSGAYVNNIDHGIVANAGPMSSGGLMTPDIQDLLVADNTVFGANRTRLSYTVGAFHYGWVKNLKMFGNNAHGCGVNGMTIVGPMDAMEVVDFESLRNVTGGGERNAVRIMAPCTGQISDVLSDGNTVGIRFSGVPQGNLSIGQVTMVGGGAPVY